MTSNNKPSSVNIYDPDEMPAQAAGEAAPVIRPAPGHCLQLDDLPASPGALLDLEPPLDLPGAGLFRLRRPAFFPPASQLFFAKATRRHPSA
jgi:hypothetical protein